MLKQIIGPSQPVLCIQICSSSSETLEEVFYIAYYQIFLTEDSSD